MKKIFVVLLTLAIVMGMCACGGDTEPKAPEGLQAGFSRENITPLQPGVQIAGGDASSRLSSGYLDEVSLSCVALSLGEEQFLVFTMDFMITNKSYVSAMETAVTEATGIAADKMLFNCTHNHSGVNINSTSWDGAEAYRSMVNQAAATAAKTAIADLSAAEVYYGSTMTEHLTFVRHYNMADGTTAGNGHGNLGLAIESHMYDSDTEVQAIKLTRAAEDKKDIILMSFPAHATIVNGTNRDSISADYPGAARSHIEANSDTLVAFFQGASGDQIPDSKIPGMCPLGKQYKEYGKALGDYVLALEYTKVENSDIALRTWEYTGNSMKEGLDDAELMSHATEIASVSAQKGSSHNDVKSLVAKYGFNSVYEATGLISRSNAPMTRTMVLNTLTFGTDVAMVFAPYEMFGMHGRFIKDNSPYAMDFIVTCGESHQGYLPHIEGCEHGFYEYDVTNYERGTGEKVAQEFVDVLTQIKGQG